MKQEKDFSKLPRKGAKKKKGEVKKGLARLINLLITLNQGVLNLDRAAQENGVSRRTILRDIETLEQAGIPLYKPNAQNVNYRVREDFNWAKFRITKENALDFADALAALTKQLGNPVKFVLPVQEEVLKAGKKEQKKRKEKLEIKHCKALEEEFLASFVADDSFEEDPLRSMFVAFGMDKEFDNSEKNHWYAKWQNIHLMRSCARMAWLGRRHNDALFFCDQIIKKEPSDTWAYKQAALTCYTKKDYKKAVEYVLEGYKQNQSDEVLYTYLIFLLIQLKDYESALRFFHIFCKDKLMRVRFAAFMYGSQGLFDKAEEVIEKAKKDDPESVSDYDKIKEEILAIYDKESNCQTSGKEK